MKSCCLLINKLFSIFFLNISYRPLLKKKYLLVENKLKLEKNLFVSLAFTCFSCVYLFFPASFCESHFWSYYEGIFFLLKGHIENILRFHAHINQIIVHIF